MNSTIITNILSYEQLKKEDKVYDDIETVKKLLSTHNNYHFKYDENENEEFTLYLDIDKGADNFTIDDFIEFFSIFINEKYGFEIEKDDIKYTRNFSKKISYHISIPKIKAKVSDMLSMAKYINKNTSFKLDTNVYNHEYFRCPNQMKENKKGTEHIIQYGKLEDFIITNMEHVIYTLKIEKEKQQQPDQQKSKSTNFGVKEDEDEVIKLIFKLVDILAPTYYDDFEEWSKVGFILKNYECKYNCDLSKLFHIFSSKSDKYDERSVEKFYQNIKPDGRSNLLTIASLCTYAKESDFQRYKDIMRKYYELNKFEIDEKFLAKKMYDIGGCKLFVYKDNVLYAFSRQLNRWFEDGKDIMKNFINDELKDYLVGLIHDFTSDETIQKNLLREVKHYTTINKNKNALIEEYQNRYGRLSTDFEFDDKPYILPFNNGLYDLQENVFRPYKYNDYITQTTGYNYKSADETKKSKINRIIETIETDEQKRHLLLQILSTGLINKSHQVFVIMNGSGANGKSLISKFMQKTLGFFYYRGNIDTLTTEKIKSGANQEVAMMHLKRYVAFSEPSCEDLINNAIIKSLTGEGTINARQLFSTKVETKLRCNIVLECNKRLNFRDKIEYGEERRLIDYEFTSRFTFDESELNPSLKIFMAEQFSDEDFENYKYEFLSILIESAVKFINEEGEKFKITSSVAERTREYIDNSDIPYTLLVEEIEKGKIKKFEKTEEIKDTDFISISDIYTIFKTSEIYFNMSKEDRRKYNLKAFNNCFMTHSKTKNIFKLKHNFNDGEKRTQTSNILMGFTLTDEISCASSFGKFID